MKTYEFKEYYSTHPCSNSQILKVNAKVIDEVLLNSYHEKHEATSTVDVYEYKARVLKSSKDGSIWLLLERKHESIGVNNTTVNKDVLLIPLQDNAELEITVEVERVRCGPDGGVEKEVTPIVLKA